MLADHSDGQIFNPQERRMIERVLNLNQRTVSSIMTSRHDIEHIDLTAPEEHIRALLDKNQHTRVVVTGGEEEEELLGVVHVIDLLQQQLHGEPLNLRALVRQPLVFPEVAVALCPGNSVTRAPTLPLWWMSLVRLKGWSRSAT
jgi:CBS domain containing-hemolysin-like protein